MTFIYGFYCNFNSRIKKSVGIIIIGVIIIQIYIAIICIKYRCREGQAFLGIAIMALTLCLSIVPSSYVGGLHFIQTLPRVRLAREM